MLPAGFLNRDVAPGPETPSNPGGVAKANGPPQTAAALAGAGEIRC